MSISIKELSRVTNYQDKIEGKVGTILPQKGKEIN